MVQVSYAQAMVEMRRTVFCFLLPSDTASSRRLSDIMMAGCIPVFLGAPYHAMPLAGEIPYKDFALFFQLHAFQRNSSMCAPDAGPAHVVMCMPLGLGTLSPNTASGHGCGCFDRVSCMRRQPAGGVVCCLCRLCLLQCLHVCKLTVLQC